MNEVMALLCQEVSRWLQESDHRVPEAEEEEPPWLMVWSSDRKTLLMSESGEMMIYPELGKPFDC